MKKSLLAAALVFVLAAGAFSKSAKQEAAPELTENDSYGEAADEASQEKAAKPKKKSVWDKKYDPYNEQKMHPTDRTTAQKFFGSNRFNVMDECYMFIKPIVGKIKVKKGHFIYRRGTDVAGFQIYYDTSAYAVQMSQETRAVCTEAINRYFSDFENKKLDKKMKASKTKVIYGSGPGFEEYGVVLALPNYYSKPKFSFGYEFVNGSPYFVIHVSKAENLGIKNKSSETNNESIVQNYYFTRAQATKLKEFISDENIALLDESIKIEKAIKESAADDYVEADAPDGEAAVEADPQKTPEDY